MRKLFKQVLSLVAIASMGVPFLHAATNDYRIEIKNDAFSKHSRDGLYGITYTEENTTYTDNNWPLAEMSHAYTQSNYSYTLARLKWCASLECQWGWFIGLTLPKTIFIGGTLLPENREGQLLQNRMV